VNSCAVSASGSEREVAVLRIVVYSLDFLKMSQQSHLESSDTEFFIDELQQLSGICDST
jgi:hypothetical protein